MTDKLRSYGVAHRELIPETIHSTQQYENNRAEQSHEATRVRERVMRRFKSVGQAQRFVAREFNLSKPSYLLVTLCTDCHSGAGSYHHGIHFGKIQQAP